MGIEDKIFFFMTLKQLIITGAGLSVCYVLYTMFNSLGVIPWLIPSIVILAITAMIAFFRFNLMSFTRLLLRILELNTVPAKRFFFQVTDGVTDLNKLALLADIEQASHEKTAQSTPPAGTLPKDLHDLSHSVDIHHPTHE